MLKVLLVDATPQGASALGRALRKVEGVRVTCTVDAPIELAKRIEEHRPDIVLIDTDSPSRDVLEQLAAVSATAPRPVVMFTGDGDHDAIRASLRAGVCAYIVDGIAPERLAPIMRVAIERFEADQRLRALRRVPASQIRTRRRQPQALRAQARGARQGHPHEAARCQRGRGVRPASLARHAARRPPGRGRAAGDRRRLIVGLTPFWGARRSILERVISVKTRIQGPKRRVDAVAWPLH